MKKYFPLIFFLTITIVFFYKSIFLQLVPFPGDLLISEYSPWKFESYLGYNPGSYPNKAQYFDVIRQLYPWKMLVIDEIKKGHIPLWNPYNFSGSPLLANNQSSVFNPFNIIFFIISRAFAWTLFIAIQPFLASFFSYIYLRKINISKIPSLFGGISYGFCLFMSTFIEYGNFGHTIMWLPLILYLIESIRQQNHKISKLSFPIVIAITVFSGHLQLSAAILLFVLIYILIKSKYKYKLLILWLLGVTMASVQLIPTSELIFYSSRTSHDLKNLTDNFLIQFKQLILFISPDAYGNPATRNYLLKDTYPGNAIFFGIAPLIFAIYSFTKIRKHSLILFYGVSVLILLIFLTNNPISYMFYFLKLPLLSTSAPSNLIFLLVFSFSVLSAHGMELWMINKKSNILVILISIFVTFSLLVGLNIILKNAFYIKQLLPGVIVLIIIGVLLFIQRFISKKVIIFVFFAITLGELMFYFQKFNPFVPKEFIYPKSSIDNLIKNQMSNDRFWSIGASYVESNFATIFKAFSPEGYDPLYPRWYGNFINSYHDSTTRSDAVIMQPDLKKSISEQKNIQDRLDQLSVKYIFDRFENGTSNITFPEKKFNLYKKINGWRIMENTSALPRAFIAPNNCLDKNYLENCYDRNVIERSKILKYDPGRIEIKTKQKSGTLIISDTYYPGWRASVNNNEVDVLKLENGMRAINNVNPNSKVIFWYSPFSFNFGLIVSIISIIATLIFVRLKFNEK